MSKRQIVGINRVLLSGLTSLSLVVVLAFGGVAKADTTYKPYFKTFGSDVFIGGAFNTSAKGDNCSSNNYQNPGTTNPADPNAGGIFAFAKDSSGKAAGGASSQYGAIAIGPVQGDPSSAKGFYSGGAQAGAVSHNYTTFANTSSSNWGGGFEGNVPSSCIPDYYDAKQQNPQKASGDVTSLGTMNGQYLYNNGGITTINGAALQPGQKVTIFVNGNVYISSSITYNLDKVDNVPKFTLVAKGSIYVDPTVGELDGLYIAQPASSDVSADDGDIWTCHGKDSNQVLYSYPAFLSACKNKLTVNGAFIAKQVLLTRINGDVAGASTNEDSLANALSSGNIGEVINYSPSMIMGGPFFNPSTTNTFNVESVTSLPPIF